MNAEESVLPKDATAEEPTAQVHALSAEGRYGEAFAIAFRELAAHPTDAEWTFARATVLFDWGRIREAREAFLRAEAMGIASTALYLNLAWTGHLLRQSEDAERYARKAIAADPSAVAAHFGLGTVLQRLKRYSDAIASYERALELDPAYAQGAAGIGHCKLEQQDHQAAEQWMRRAIALAPENPQFRTNLGVALANQERYAEALLLLREAEAIETAAGLPPESVIDTGFALVSMGRNDEAIELYRRHLPRIPDPRAHGHYAFLLLTRGALRQGWEQYEFRWMQEPHLSHRPGVTQPPWQGQNLAGKTILLLVEQGAGDIFHFARYAMPLKAMGATVVLQVRPEILDLAKGLAGVDQVFAPPTKAPPFDYYVHLMSVPRVLGTRLATIPADVPYLRTDKDRAVKWAARLGDGGFKVGVAWAGNPKYPRDKFRSIPFDRLQSLWDQRGVRYFSLQKPLKQGELEQFPQGSTLVNLESELADFADTAAAIDQMDLVICVDTAIAHIAGALGKPVWLLLPEVGDFRWLEHREDSPWYPTMRLFRQRRLGDWDDVVARVNDALRDAVASGSVRTAAVDATRSADATSVEVDEPVDPSTIARVTETRHGLLQYLPDGGPEARSIAGYGEYLEPQLSLLAQWVRPGAQVVEAGSGVGVHALALAGMVGAQGHLLLYETRPVISRILHQNLNVNRQSLIVTLMRRRIAGRRGSASGAQMGTEVSTETLDDLLLERLDLVKIRAAADALDILGGANDTLWRLRPLLFIDAVDAAAVARLAARAREFGYRCWRMDTPYFDPGNFHCRDDDIFNGEKALALLAIPEEVDVAVVPAGCVEITDRVAAAGAQSSDATSDDGAPGLLGKLRKLLR